MLISSILVNSYQVQIWSQTDLGQKVSHNSNCVAFRLDDIQDYFTRESQMDLIKIFLEENVPLTIGVIGGFLYDDDELIRFLNDSINTGLIEVANHGWNHLDHSVLKKEEQKESLLKTNERIWELFKIKVKTFIPPVNSFNDDTLAAMKEVGLSHLSGSIFTKADEPPYPLKNGDSIVHLPQTSFISNVDTPTGVWTIFPNNKVIEMIDSSIKLYGFSVVSMHPVAHYSMQNSSYVYQKESLNSVRELLIMIKSEFKIVKISEIIEQDWISMVDTKDMTLYALDVPGHEGLEIESSVKDLILEVSSETVFLRRTENKWEPFILLLPDFLIPEKPSVMSSGLPLPTMSWFDVESEKWVIFLDPPKQASLLSMTMMPISKSEFPTSLLVVPIMLGLVLLFSLIYARRVKT